VGLIVFADTIGKAGSDSVLNCWLRTGTYLKLSQIDKGDLMDIPVSSIRDIPKKYRRIS